MTTEKNTPTNDERLDRIKKLGELKNLGIVPYADKFDKKNNCADIANLPIGTVVKTAGRVRLLRDMGKILFAQLQDFSGKAQIVLRVGNIEKDVYKHFAKLVDMGDFVGVTGEIFQTQKGEISIMVKEFFFLSKALRPLPEKWHGVKDTELKYRKRYLDLIANEDTRAVFKFRSEFIWEMRQFYRQHDFYEIDTPVLCNTASGALAKPFITHHNALDTDVFLRIAPEIFLKEAIVGGYERIYEVARSFRNEGMDPSHLQDFTMVEHYCAYWDYEQNMVFTEQMLSTIIQKLKGTLKLEIIDRQGLPQPVDFTPSWRRVSFRELLIEDCGIDIDVFTTATALRQEIKKQKIMIEDMDKLGRGNLIDALYKTVSRPKLINPTFLTKHPLDLSPLARKNDLNPNITDRFQLVVNGWEIVNAYSELIDPIDQKERFEQQGLARESGDEEAMAKDDDYVEAMEYGMPPISGWGMGIERIVALLTQQSNLRDVVLFPLMKPEK
ncbi:MAG: lysine--tRNA ligase [Candidatus Falkowbacteria bacterium]